MTSKPRSKLKLLDLRGDGCIRLGAPTDAVNARSHGAGRTLGQVIYSEHKEIDGLLFSSRLTSADVFVIFDRAIQKIHSIESGKLQDHPELCDTLSKYNIQLITS